MFDYHITGHLAVMVLAAWLSTASGCGRQQLDDGAGLALNEQFVGAVEAEQWSLALDLLERGADPNVQNEGGIPPLILAVMAEDHALLSAMLAKGAGLDVIDPYSFGNPLFVAAEGGDEGAARILLNAGMDVNARNRNGWTPLMAACALGDAVTVRTLLDAGADPVMGTPEGRMTPLDLATSRDGEESKEIVVLLRSSMNAPSGG